jgi:DNA-binding transcriptional LysR family regulator
VTLTAAGEAFLPEAVTIAEAMSEGRERVQNLAGLATGRASVMVAQGWEAWPGWDFMVTEFRRLHPGIAMAVTQGDSVDQILTAVASGAADLGVLATVDVPAAPGLRIEPLHAESIHVALPPDHRFAGRERIALDELRDERWVLPPIERDLLIAAVAATDLGWVPTIDDGAPTSTMVRSLVLASAGVAILGRSEVDFYHPAAIAELVEPQLIASILIAYRAAYRTAATRTIRDFLRSQFPAPD